MTIILRLLHIILGMMWVGSALFAALFLAPALQDSGPEGGKVMAALQKRGMMVAMPIFAITTLITGFWMYFRDSGGMSTGWASSSIGKAFGFGGGVALLAFVTGMAFVMPAMKKAVAATQAGQMAEAQRLRTRAGTVSKIVAVMLLVAAAAMAVARYV